MNTSKLSPKVALLNFSASLGVETYAKVIDAITKFATQSTPQRLRSNSVDILGKAYLVSKAIDTSLIDFDKGKLNAFLGAKVPTFLDKPNVWFIYNQTDTCMVYFSDTLSRIDNALFDIQVHRPEVGYQDNGMFSAEYMEVISNLDTKSYVSKYNAKELSWQQPNVQTSFQVAPNIQVPNVTIPTQAEVQPSQDKDIAKALELLKNAGLI